MSESKFIFLIFNNDSMCKSEALSKELFSNAKFSKNNKFSNSDLAGFSLLAVSLSGNTIKDVALCITGPLAGDGILDTNGEIRDPFNGSRDADNVAVSVKFLVCLSEGGYAITGAFFFNSCKMSGLFTIISKDLLKMVNLTPSEFGDMGLYENACGDSLGTATRSERSSSLNVDKNESTDEEACWYKHGGLESPTNGVFLEYEMSAGAAALTGYVIVFFVYDSLL